MAFFLEEIIRALEDKDLSSIRVNLVI